MTPTHDAALQVARESFAMLRAALEGLPDEAADWAPAPNTNSLAVLTAHCVTSSRFFFGCGAGAKTSIMGYFSHERRDAFASKGPTISGLLGDIDTFLPELEQILAKGEAADLSARISWPDEAPKEPERTGMDFLFRITAHLREHVGQAQLMRDLWLARS